MKKIGIIDYGMGNLHSVSNACKYLGINTFISGKPDELDSADALILPGVGAFPDAVRCLIDTGNFDYLRNHRNNKPILGICLGMQLLFERGCEVKLCDGLGLIEGEIIGLNSAKFGYKIPHMGWNKLDIRNLTSPLMKGIDSGAYTYFVHSFMASPKHDRDIIASAEYGEDVCAIVGDDEKRVYGTQFHPEKSGETGLMILKNFADMIF